jgi:hypothetical protein
MKMKRIKQILAVALASVMTVGMLSTVALAAEEETTTATEATTEADTTNTTKVITSIPISKTVEVNEKGTKLPSETFQFKMVPATDDQLLDENGNPVKDSNGQVIEAGLPLKTDTIGIAFDASDNTSTGSFTRSGSFTLDFDGASFEHTGVYRYYLYETGSKGLGDTETTIYDDDGNVKDNPYITFDTTQYIVDLYVTQDENGKFVVSSYHPTISGSDKKPGTISFTNKIACSTLKIFKEVKGTEYKKGELYTFRILVPVGGTSLVMAQDQKIEARIYDTNGLVNDDRSDANGIINIIVNGDKITADMATYATEFQLKAGEYLEVTGVPVSMIYRVEEVTDTDEFKIEGYTVTYDYEETGDNTDTDTYGKKYDQTYDSETGIQGTINTDKNEVTFINTRKIENPNTGISMDVVPYVLIVLAVVCGGLLLIFKKRRTAR